MILLSFSGGNAGHGVPISCASCLLFVRACLSCFSLSGDHSPASCEM